MLRCITLRLALPVVLSATLLPAAAFAQSQDSQSVAEAARRAREQKKTPAKPAKVITEDDVKPAAQSTPATPASPDATAASATAASAAPAPPASSTANAVSAPEATAASGAPAASSSPAPDAKDQKDSKEVNELKAQIKQAQGDLDLLQREQSLEQDNYYSNTDYAHDKAGKAKLDALKQQVRDNQQELERLKARLAELQAAQNASVSVPPKP